MSTGWVGISGAEGVQVAAHPPSAADRRPRWRSMPRRPRATAGPRRTYVLDTSVLLADPASLRRFDEHDVVLPVVVLSELEGKRHHPELGWAAREALRALKASIVGLDAEEYRNELAGDASWSGHTELDVSSSV